MKKHWILCILILFFCGCRWLTTPYQNNQTIVVITIDDLFSSIWTGAYPLLTEFGYPATSFINTMRVGNANFLTWEQITYLELHEGWETGGHTLRHEDLVSLTYEEAETNVHQDFMNMKAHGLNPVSFATPGGDCPTSYYPILQKYYKIVRSAHDFCNKQPINPYALGYLSFKTEYNAQQMIHRVQLGISRHESIIILGFHQFNETDPPDVPDNCTPQEFRQILQWLHDHHLKVMTLRDAVDAFN